MEAARREVDTVTAFREGVEEFCDKHRAEILAYIALQLSADIKMVVAEVIAIRGNGDTLAKLP